MINEIDKKIDASRDAVAKLTIELVNIKSEQGEAENGAPFGIGPKKVLDKVLESGRSAGYICKDYGVGVVSVALKSAKTDLGIWIHGDVVPAGEGWNFEPYNATEYKGCIIGRGAGDNKGQLAAMFTLLNIFKEMDIDLKYNPALYVGSNEETGMGDVKAFLNVAEPPRLSLVPDGGFSVGFGGKGVIILKLRSNNPLHNCRLYAGNSENPGLATAVFDSEILMKEISDCIIEGNTLSAYTPPCHSASPNPNGNMITVLSDMVLKNKLYYERDKKIWEFMRDVSSHINGDILGIETKSEVMGALTVCAVSVDDIEGCPEITLNIRFPIEITAEEIAERVKNSAADYGFSLTSQNVNTIAYLTNKETPVVSALCEASDEITGEKILPYTMSGSTYANYLPNAYVYGTNANLPPANFPKGRGSVHGVDEAVSLDRLLRAMKIYARALLRLNEIDW